MLDIMKCEKIPDNEVVFFDGLLYIIIRDREPYVDDEYHDAEYSIEVKCLTAEYDDPITLVDIAEQYPKVCKVIFEDMLKGKIFNYGNHGAEKDAEMWELVGTTVGYA